MSGGGQRGVVTALLLLAHGSPRAAANEPVLAVLRQVRARRIYDVVEVAFLERNAPDIPTGIDLCVQRGARRIVALPYFLHAGGHVAEDLPRILEAGRARHPHVEFLLGDFLGASPRVTDVLAERATQAVQDSARGGTNR